MDLKSYFQKLNSGEVQAHSELGTRDESKQSRNFGTRISKMKTVTGINARAMVFKDVVIPFNPFTGKADGVYNKKTAFRPILLVEQVLNGLKDAMAESPEMKAFWEKELGISFSDGPATMDEYAAFKKAGYIKPRIMSYPTVAMNFNGAHGFPEFRVKYTVDPTELNEEGTYDAGSAPAYHKAAHLAHAVLRAEADEVTKNLEANGASKDAVKSQRRAIFDRSPVGFVSPTNLIPFLFYPLNEVPKAIDPANFKELESNIRFYSFTDKWVVPLKEAMNNPLYDEDMNVYDFTIKTPSSTDTKKNGQVYTDDDANELYAAMTITNTDGRMALHGGSTSDGSRTIKNEECFAPVFDAAKAYFADSQEQSTVEGGETFEKIMAASSRFRPITTIMDNFLPAFNDVFNTSFAGSKYFSEDIKRGHADILTMMNPKNALALADVDEDELDEAAAQQRKGVSELIAETTGRGTPDDVLGVSGSPDISDLDLV